MGHSHTIDIYGIGIAADDHIFLVDPYPELDTKSEVVAAAHQAGGPVCTALAAAAALGAKCRFLTIIGDDPPGHFVLNQLQVENICTADVILCPESNTPSASIWVDRSTGGRTVVLDHRRSRYPHSSELNLRAISNSRVLLSDGRGEDLTVSAFRAARQAGVVTMLDAGSLRPGIDKILALTDLIIASETFAKAYTDRTQALEMLTCLVDQYPRSLIVITRGYQGAILAHRDEIWKIPAISVNVVDTTGAGDVFHGVFAAAHSGSIGDFDPVQTAMLATAAAGLSCQALGGRGFLPTLPLIDNALASASSPTRIYRNR